MCYFFAGQLHVYFSSYVRGPFWCTKQKRWREWSSEILWMCEDFRTLSTLSGAFFRWMFHEFSDWYRRDSGNQNVWGTRALWTALSHVPRQDPKFLVSDFWCFSFVLYLWLVWHRDLRYIMMGGTASRVLNFNLLLPGMIWGEDHLLLSNPDLVASNIAVAWKWGKQHSATFHG